MRFTCKCDQNQHADAASKCGQKEPDTSQSPTNNKGKRFTIKCVVQFRCTKIVLVRKPSLENLILIIIFGKLLSDFLYFMRVFISTRFISKHIRFSGWFSTNKSDKGNYWVYRQRNLTLYTSICYESFKKVLSIIYIFSVNVYKQDRNSPLVAITRLQGFVNKVELRSFSLYSFNKQLILFKSYSVLSLWCSKLPVLFVNRKSKSHFGAEMFIWNKLSFRMEGRKEGFTVESIAGGFGKF